MIQKARIDPTFSANWLAFQDKINEIKTKTKNIGKKMNTTEKKNAPGYSPQ